MTIPIQSQRNTIQYRFKNVKDWDGEMKYSDDFEINNVKWKIGLQLKERNHPYIYLNCTSMENEKTAKICAANIEFAILKQSGNNDHLRKMLGETQYFVDGDCEKGTYLDNSSWMNIQNECYRIVENDSIVIEINFDFTFCDFSKNIPNYTDFILEIEDVDLHINKGLLCSCSDYFYNLLIDDNCTEEINKMQINDVKLIDFMKLLMFMHPNYQIMTNKIENAQLKFREFEKYLNLADQFKMRSIFLKSALELQAMCNNKKNENNFANSYGNIGVIMKCIKFADKYNYPNILEPCFDLFKTSREIKRATETVEFDGLCQTSKVQLLRRLLNFVS